MKRVFSRRFFSFATAIVTALVTYSLRIEPGDDPRWLSSLAIAYRSDLIFAALASAIAAAAMDWWEHRHPHRAILQKLIEDFSKTHFHDEAKRNRVTLFMESSGWKVLLISVLNLPLFSKCEKWKALWRISQGAKYLRVYARPVAVRSARSFTAFRVSDDPQECEGVAGIVWEENYCILSNLPQVDRAAVRKMLRLEDLDEDDPIRVYATQTNIRNLSLLKSLNFFARHFMGTIVRDANGLPRGVLLLDAEGATCPFSEEDDTFKSRFDDLARMIGKVIG